MRPSELLVTPPSLNNLTRLVQVCEAVLVQTVVSKPAIEALNEDIPSWPAMPDDIWPRVGERWTVALEIFSNGSEYRSCQRHKAPGSPACCSVRFLDCRISFIAAYPPA